MNEINRDIYLVQNPAIGAVLLWQFVCEYYNYDDENKQAPLPLLFIVLPVVFREDLRKTINRTQRSSGLQKVSEKLFNEKQSDFFYRIQNSAEEYKELTLTAINIAVNRNLIGIISKTAQVYPVQTKVTKMPKSSDELLKAAKKLGEWCSSLSMHEISLLLKVRF